VRGADEQVCGGAHLTLPLLGQRAPPSPPEGRRGALLPGMHVLVVRRSARHQPAIDVVGLSGDVARPGRGEEDRHAAMSSALLARRIGMFASCSAWSSATVMPRSACPRHGVARSELGARHPRANRIDVDVVAAELLRRHPCQ